MYLAEKQTKVTENDVENDAKNGYSEHPGKEIFRKFRYSRVRHSAIRQSGFKKFRMLVQVASRVQRVQPASLAHLPPYIVCI